MLCAVGKVSSDVWSDLRSGNGYASCVLLRTYVVLECCGDVGALPYPLCETNSSGRSACVTYSAPGKAATSPVVLLLLVERTKCAHILIAHRMSMLKGFC